MISLMTSLDQQLSKLVRAPDSVFDMAECALIVAQHEYPNLDIHAYLQRLDQIADRLRQRLPADAGKPHLLSMLNHYLFRELGYAGNLDDYYDPRNSFLNDVIDRRVGIPITLSIFYMEIGRRIGVNLQGVSFPGHFLAKCTTDQGVIVIDPFNKGASLSEADLRGRLKQSGAGDDSAEIPLAPLLRPATPKEILARLARNLKAIYVESGELEKAIAMTSLILAINTNDAKELRDRAQMYQKLSCFRAALADFERLVEIDADAAEDDGIRDTINELKQKNRLLH
jgi:regulator of sirC expression with transglutaminase-like and TPR domain